MRDFRMTLIFATSNRRRRLGGGPWLPVAIHGARRQKYSAAGQEKDSEAQGNDAVVLGVAAARSW
jgi:hypothetical protein